MELRSVAIHPTLKQIDVRIEEAFFKDTKILCEGSGRQKNQGIAATSEDPWSNSRAGAIHFAGFLLNFTRFRQL
jgi:hypothetical protein